MVLKPFQIRVEDGALLCQQQVTLLTSFRRARGSLVPVYEFQVMNSY